MRLKETLGLIGKLENEIDSGIMELKLLRELRERLGEVFCDDKKIEKRIYELDCRVALLFDARECADALFYTLRDPDLSRLLRLRYVQELTWERISELTHYSLSQTHRRHRKALSMLEKLL